MPRKGLGQNFLLDKDYLQKITNSCQINEKTTIIEIGSGYGHLTSFLSATSCKRVISIEKDHRLFVWLNSNWIGNKKKVIFCEEDALKINWLDFCQKYRNENSPIIVVGNLPYSIANLLIHNLLTNYFLFQDLVFLVQKEVAERWATNLLRYKKEYGALSIYISIFAETQILFTVPSKYFSPSPLVDGSLVHLKIRKELLIEKQELVKFLAFLRNCFRHRRKTLENNLLIASYKKEIIKKILCKFGHSSLTRSQELSTQDFIQLYREIKNLNLSS